MKLYLSIFGDIMKTQINLKLRADILERLDEKAKKQHRTRTNLIEKILIDELLVTQQWLAVKMNINDPGADLKEGDEGIWEGCDVLAKKGDKILIYRTSPNMHIKYLAETTEDAKEGIIDNYKGEKIKDHLCGFKVLYNFEDPLTFKEIKDYPSLVEWYPLKSNLNRQAFNIEEKDWNTLRDILITKNRNSKDYF